MDELKDLTATAAHLTRARQSYIGTDDYEGTKKFAMEARIIRALEDGMVAAADLLNQEDGFTVDAAAAFENFHVTRAQVMEMLKQRDAEPEPEPVGAHNVASDVSVPEMEAAA